MGYTLDFIAQYYL